MLFLNLLVKVLYSLSTLALVIYAAVLSFGGQGFVPTFHALGPYFPVISSFFVIGFQFELLKKILARKELSLRARVLDCIHWLMLIGFVVSTWLSGGTSIIWYAQILLIVGAIGWQIGVLSRHTTDNLSGKEKFAGAAGALIAVSLGVLAGYMRTIDQSAFGYGWALEVLTAVVATFIVMWFISLDLQVIRRKHDGYSRQGFLKAVVGGNLLIVLSWVHVMSAPIGGDLLSALAPYGIVSTEGGNWSNFYWWAHNFAYSFNTIVGNLIFLYYYLTYEFHRSRQEAVALKT